MDWAQEDRDSEGIHLVLVEFVTGQSVISAVSALRQRVSLCVPIIAPYSLPDEVYCRYLREISRIYEIAFVSRPRSMSCIRHARPLPAGERRWNESRANARGDLLVFQQKCICGDGLTFIPPSTKAMHRRLTSAKRTFERTIVGEFRRIGLLRLQLIRSKTVARNQLCRSNCCNFRICTTVLLTSALCHYTRD